MIARVVLRTVAVASYVAYFAGLIWTGQLDADLEPTAPLDPIDLRASPETPARLEVTARAGGEVDVRLALSAIPDSELASPEFSAWLEEKKDLSLALLVADTGGGEPRRWTVADTDPDRARTFRTWLVLDQTRIRVEENHRYAFTVEVGGSERRLFDYDPVYLIGPHEEPNPAARPDVRPGLLLLVGGTGVFVHVFMLLARLLVPFRANALPDEDLIGG